MPWCKQSGACQRSGPANRQLRPPFARAGRDLPLHKPIKGAIVVSKPPGICRMSVKYPAMPARSLVLALLLVLWAPPPGHAAEPAGTTVVLQVRRHGRVAAPRAQAAAPRQGIVPASPGI